MTVLAKRKHRQKLGECLLWQVKDQETSSVQYGDVEETETTPKHTLSHTCSVQTVMNTLCSSLCWRMKTWIITEWTDRGTNGREKEKSPEIEKKRKEIHKKKKEKGRESVYLVSFLLYDCNWLNNFDLWTKPDSRGRHLINTFTLFQHILPKTNELH